MAWQIALDIGGTFTDLMAIEDETREIRSAKSSTTPHDLTVGIVNCIDASGVPLDKCRSFVHGATVAINTLIEQTGARTSLVTTMGARDVYAIGRGNRPEAYNIHFRRPKPLVPRDRTFEVEERMRATGEVETPLTEAEIEAVCDRVAASKPEAIAVCFLHSYENPAHEQRMGAALRKRFPSTFISLSHEIMRQYREYERTSTTVVNSYVGPRVSRYLNDLERVLKRMGFAGKLFIMQSNGGVSSVQTAAEIPVALMESGPAGGINASAELALRLGHERAIAFDMGGTTAKASLIKDGIPAMSEGYYVGGYAEGHPVMLPVVDVVEVGAGGGSIGWIDDVGALKVGPKSAGASPGPVCYGAGGTEPTVTDANLVLGRIDPERFLGGRMKLDVAAARKAVKEKIADRLGLSVEAAALGIVRIAISRMTLAVRRVSLEQGYDPRDFVLISSGGAGGFHATEIARELAIPKVIVPVFPAHFSALGMLKTDIRHDYVRTFNARLEGADFAALGKIHEEIGAQARKALSEDGVARGDQEVDTYLDLRYVGQEYYLTVPVDVALLSTSNTRAIRDAYDALHEHHFGHKGSDEAVEIVNMRLSGRGVRQKIETPPPAAEGSPGAARRRPVWFDAGSPWADCPIHARGSLTAGSRIVGPAIIEEDATTVVLLPGDKAEIDASGSILIGIGGEARQAAREATGARKELA
jgi:N-methylhydantoinase A